MNPMFSQYKQKKKRAVDPDAPPRPNLLTHEKRLKEYDTQVSSQAETITKQQEEINRLRAKVNRLESTVNSILSYLKR